MTTIKPRRVEADECRDLRNYLTAHGYTFTEAPRRSAGFSRSGYASGRFDFEIASYRGAPCRIAIEMKRADGGTVSEKQVNQLWLYRQSGSVAVICWGASDAMTFLTELAR